MNDERFVTTRTLCRIVFRRLDDASRQQLWRQLHGRSGVHGLRVNAVRHIVNIIVYSFSSYRAWITRALLTCTACTVFCQPTVEYIVVYRASDMHGMYYHIVTEYTTTSSFRLPLGEELRCGHLLRMST